MSFEYDVSGFLDCGVRTFFFSTPHNISATRQDETKIILDSERSQPGLSEYDILFDQSRLVAEIIRG